VEHKKVSDRINPRTEEIPETDGEKGSSFQKEKDRKEKTIVLKGILESSRSTVPYVRVAPRRAQAGM
jgi:hypothetical protein